MKMKPLYGKIALGILLIACLVLAIDKAKMSYRLAGIASRIAEKTQIIEENEARYQENLSSLEDTMQEMEQSFHLVLPDDLPHMEADEPSLSGQVPLDPADLAAAKSLADGLVHKDPLSLAAAVDALFAAREKKTPEVFALDSETGRMMGRSAAFVEEAARQAGLHAKTVFRWDMLRSALKSETSIFSSTQSAQAPVKRVYGIQIDSAYEVVQEKPVTTFFPFDGLFIMARGERLLIPENQYFPVGGLYVHYFRVSSKGPWFLDYEFPGDVDPDFVNLRAVSLLPGSTIQTAGSGTVRSFRVLPKNNDAVFLVVADRPFFPKKVTACLSLPKYKNLSPVKKRPANSVKQKKSKNSKRRPKKTSAPVSVVK